MEKDKKNEGKTTISEQTKQNEEYSKVFFDCNYLKTRLIREVTRVNTCKGR